MKRSIWIFLLAGGLMLLIGWALSSSNKKEDITQKVDTDGSVETAISVVHSDSTHDVLLTTHKVWLKGQQYKIVVHADTIPALDSATDEASNDNGDQRLVRYKKDYQLFITVK